MVLIVFFLDLFIDFSLVLNRFHVLFFAGHCFFHWFSLVYLSFIFGFHSFRSFSFVFESVSYVFFGCHQFFFCCS